MCKSQTGGLRGHIISFQNEALSDVNVRIQDSQYGTYTDENGYYSLHNITAGTYTFLISITGYSVVKQYVTITSGKTTNLNLQLSQDQKQLEEVTVTGKNTQYKSSHSMLATRTDVPILETPQSIQVISQQIIKDRQAFTLNDIAPLMTGVKANNSMGGFALRGFTGYNPNDASFTTFNGIRGTLYLWSQQPLLYNIENVEILRGPASVLLSESMPGGIINFVTKKPQVENRFEFSAAYGSWNAARFSADATGALTKNKKLLYRAIVGYDRTNSFRDYQKVKNFFVAPSLSYVFSSNTSLNLET